MKKSIFLLLLSIVFLACSKDEGTETAPPASLTYNVDNVFVQNSTEVNLTPSSSGGPVSNYTITPELPAGLSLNPTTGVISGIPTALSPRTTFTVTATNSGGSTTFDLILTVNAVAPVSLSYTISDAVLVTDTSVVNWIPASSGGVISNYSITPQLPAGMSINPTTGVISGKPSEGAPMTSYTITGTNSGGGTSAQVAFSVNVSVTTPITRIKEIYTVYTTNEWNSYEYTYDNGLLSTETFKEGGGSHPTTTGIEYQFYYNNGKISSIGIARLLSNSGGQDNWSTAVSYGCSYLDDRISVIFANTSSFYSYSYNSQGQVIYTDGGRLGQIGNGHVAYGYYPNSNLRIKTFILGSASFYDDISESYDEKTNPYFLGGFNTEYLAMYAIPINNPTKVYYGNTRRTEELMYVYNTLNYPVKALGYIDGGLNRVVTFTYE